GLQGEEPDRATSHDKCDAFERTFRNRARTCDPREGAGRRLTLPASKCRAGALRLGLFCFRLPRHRDNTERGNAVALPTQHAKAEAVEGEALAAFGDRT